MVYNIGELFIFGDTLLYQCRSYHSLASCMVEEEKISREYQMYGHRQTKPPGGTECPGDVLYGTIQEWEGWVSGGVIFLQSLIIIFQTEGNISKL